MASFHHFVQTEISYHIAAVRVWITNYNYTIVAWYVRYDVDKNYHIYTVVALICALG